MWRLHVWLAKAAGGRGGGASLAPAFEIDATQFRTDAGDGHDLVVAAGDDGNVRIDVGDDGLTY